MPVYSSSAQTRMGMGGWGVRPAGDFSGKVEVGVFLINIPASEGNNGKQEIIAEDVGSSNTITIRALDGVQTVAQTINNSAEITISSARGVVILMADGVSNWIIISRVGT